MAIKFFKFNKPNLATFQSGVQNIFLEMPNKSLPENTLFPFYS